MRPMVIRNLADSGIAPLRAIRIRPVGRLRNHMIRQPNSGCNQAEQTDEAR
ncbi:hypothetical protein D3C86_2089150 [compost metagenome]